MLDERLGVGAGGVGVGLAVAIQLAARARPVEAGRHRQPLTTGDGLLDLLDLLAVGGSDEDLDLTAAGQSHVERIVVGDAVGDQLRRAGLQHLLGAQHDIGLDAAARDRAGHLAVLGDQQPRAQRARRRALGVDHRGNGEWPPLVQQPLGVREHVSHVVNRSHPRPPPANPAAAADAAIGRLAASIARRVSTVARCDRYSADPASSPIGRRPSAAWAAASAALPPVQACSAARCPHGRQAHAGHCHPQVRPADGGRHADDRPVRLPAAELDVGGRAELGHPHLGDQLARLERGGEEVDEQVVGVDRARSRSGPAPPPSRPARAAASADRRGRRPARSTRRSCRGSAPAGRRCRPPSRPAPGSRTGSSSSRRRPGGSSSRPPPGDRRRRGCRPARRCRRCRPAGRGDATRSLSMGTSEWPPARTTESPPSPSRLTASATLSARL